MGKTIQAKSLTQVQLKMLDIGAPVIVPCQTLAGDIIHVRLQTKNLQPGSDHSTSVEGAKMNTCRHSEGCWESHGVYVAIMPDGVDYGS